MIPGDNTDISVKLIQPVARHGRGSADSAIREGGLTVGAGA